MEDDNGRILGKEDALLLLCKMLLLLCEWSLRIKNDLTRCCCCFIIVVVLRVLLLMLGDDKSSRVRGEIGCDVVGLR